MAKILPKLFFYRNLFLQIMEKAQKLKPPKFSAAQHAGDYSSRDHELHYNVEKVKSCVTVRLFLPLDIKERET